VRDGADDGPGALAPESLVRVRVNDDWLLTWSCTAHDLPTLAFGWLTCEGVAHEPTEVTSLEIVEAPAGWAAEIRIRLEDAATGRLARTLMPGTPGSARPPQPPFASLRRAPAGASAELQATLEDRDAVAAWFREMFERAELRSRIGGLHTGGLVLEGRLQGVEEDVSRHHVVDRLVGRAVREDVPLPDAILLLSARISGAMAAKACRAGVGALISRSIPTELAATIAARNGLILVGRARREKPHYHWPAGTPGADASGSRA
jgi:FdhD protein